MLFDMLLKLSDMTLIFLTSSLILFLVFVLALASFPISSLLLIVYSTVKSPSPAFSIASLIISIGFAILFPICNATIKVRANITSPNIILLIRLLCICSFICFTDILSVASITSCILLISILSRLSILAFILLTNVIPSAFI
ncbi:hypothetical protein D3C73_1160520 [compost metagenome]